MKNFYGTVAIVLVVGLAACSEEAPQMQETSASTERGNKEETSLSAAPPTPAEKTSASGESVLGNHALVEGGDYDATGSTACAMGRGQPSGSCPFGVKREGNGSGTVRITKPDGSTRTIFFKDGYATGADTSEDPGQFLADWHQDITVVRIGDERYEIPDVVIFGY